MKDLRVLHVSKYHKCILMKRLAHYIYHALLQLSLIHI